MYCVAFLNFIHPLILFVSQSDILAIAGCSKEEKAYLNIADFYRYGYDKLFQIMQREKVGKQDEFIKRIRESFLLRTEDLFAPKKLSSLENDEIDKYYNDTAKEYLEKVVPQF